MNILIVDDELNVRKTIVNIISKNVMYDIDILQAENGEDAWNILNSSDISILICDIIMSGMTGVELAKKVRQSGMDCKIIFISAYDNKEYLKAAIELDIIGYIDKPIDKTKLLSILNDVLKKDNAAKTNTDENEIMRQELVNYLTSNQNDNEKADMLINQFYGKKFEPRCFAVGICKFSYKVEEPGLCYALEKRFRCNSDGFKMIFSRKNKNTYILVFMADNKAALEVLSRQRLASIIEEFSSHINFLFSISGSTDSRNDIYKCYEEAVVMIESGFYGDYGIVKNMTLNSTEKIEMIKVVDDFNRMLDIANKTAIFDFLSDLYDKIKKARNLPSKLVVFLFKNLIYQMHLHFYNKMDAELNQEYERIESDEFLIFDELYKYFVKEVEEVLESVKTDNIVSKVKSCINKLHVNPDLTLSDISDQLNFSVGYICTRFKRATGMSVNNYLNYVRIEHAKELLKDGKYSSEQITYIVGYTDPNYFSRSFKKNTGLTVSEYRKRINDENS